VLRQGARPVARAQRVPAPAAVATPDARAARRAPAWHGDGEDDAVDDDDDDDIVVVDDDVVDSDEDDIVGDDPEAAQEEDLSLLAARSYGKKTPQQRDELRLRIQVRNGQKKNSARLHMLSLELSLRSWSRGGPV
jgi:hypothetical protein